MEGLHVLGVYLQGNEDCVYFANTVEPLLQDGRCGLT